MIAIKNPIELGNLLYEQVEITKQKHSEEYNKERTERGRERAREREREETNIGDKKQVRTREGR